MELSFLSRWRRRRYRRLLLVLIGLQTTTVALIVYLSPGSSRPFSAGQGRYAVQYLPARQWRPSRHKLILLWTPMWSRKYWWEYDQLGIPPCARRCNVTTDKARVREADAVLFHWGNLWWNTELPSYRRPYQVWVLLNSEPPHKQSNLAPWSNVFNWTMSYRRDSTVYIPFGEYSELQKDDLILARKMYAYRNFAKEKTRNVSLTISNCYDAAARYKLADEINKRLHVDMYGKCTPNKTGCVFNSDYCNNKLKEYKFHLALENSYCLDYFSEKFWETLLNDVVPIVAWKQDPGKEVPYHSYINIFDFPDLDSFTDYLRKVLSDDSLYNSFFDWRLKYKAHNNYNRQWCALCDALFNASIPAQVVKDPYAWLNSDYCAEPLVYTWLKILVRRLLFNLGL